MYEGICVELTMKKPSGTTTASRRNNSPGRNRLACQVATRHMARRMRKTPRRNRGLPASRAAGEKPNAPFSFILLNLPRIPLPLAGFAGQIIPSAAGTYTDQGSIPPSSTPMYPTPNNS